jgi:hypothetical protein
VSPFFSDLLESVGLRKRRRPNVGLRPHRDVSVALGIDAAYEHVLDAFVRTLGANVYSKDPVAHVIEAGFGLVNAERVRASLESQGTTQTIVHIEAQYRAGIERPPSSRSVDALADALEAGVGN